jgi:hypothetical protein
MVAIAVEPADEEYFRPLHVEALVFRYPLEQRHCVLVASTRMMIRDRQLAPYEFRNAGKVVVWSSFSGKLLA